MVVCGIGMNSRDRIENCVVSRMSVPSLWLNNVERFLKI